MDRIKFYWAFRRYEYGWGLGLGWFNNGYGAYGFTIKLLKWYVITHWVVPGSIAWEEEEEDAE